MHVYYIYSVCISVCMCVDLQLYYKYNDKIKIFRFDPKYYYSELKQNIFHFLSVCNIIQSYATTPNLYF